MQPAGFHSGTGSAPSCRYHGKHCSPFHHPGAGSCSAFLYPFFLLQSFLNCVVRNTSSIKSLLQVFHGHIRPLGTPLSQGIGNSYARLPAWCPGYRERDTVHSYGFLQKKRACSYHIHAEILKRAAASSFSSPSTLMVIVLIIKKPPQVQYQYIVLIQATRTGDRKVLRRQVQA